MSATVVSIGRACGMFPVEYFRGWANLFSHPAHRVLGVIIDRTTARGRMVAEIGCAEFCCPGMGERTVRRALRELRACGAIRVERNEGGRVVPLYSWNRDAVDAMAENNPRVKELIDRLCPLRDGP